jgi:catechol 2,3-dioxygenase-like lactoylglutathione lyase family enzyme
MAESEADKVSAECLTPILYVKNFAESRDYYVEKLLFRVAWEWDDPPTFGCIKLGKVEIFLSQGGQGKPGTWLYIFLDDVDSYRDRIKRLGAEVIYGPKNEPWGMREIHVRDPNGHVIRLGTGIPSRRPELEIERSRISANIESRLAALISDVARHKNMTLGEMLEETLLHSFEQLPGGGVASPHTQSTHALIQELRKKHAIDYDCHASHRFVEKKPPKPAKKAKAKRRKK